MIQQFIGIGTFTVKGITDVSEIYNAVSGSITGLKPSYEYEINLDLSPWMGGNNENVQSFYVILDYIN